MRQLIVLVLCLLPFSAWGQQEVRSLEPEHAAQLAQYLNEHKDCDFLPESVFDSLLYDLVSSSLSEFRKEGVALTYPYYMVGDFNHDGRMDFSMILAVDCDPYFDELMNQQYSYKERIVVWDGLATGFKLAWEDDQAGIGGFLIWSGEDGTKNRLCYTFPYSDVGFYLTPAGNSYIAEGWPDPSDDDS
jgi:hypothetical protein